jgi:hypothetical protein
MIKNNEIIRVGDMVNDTFLGVGTVVGIVGNTSKYIQPYFKILFKIAPPLDYNMGSNPCLRHRSDFN